MGGGGKGKIQRKMGGRERKGERRKGVLHISKMFSKPLASPSSFLDCFLGAKQRVKSFIYTNLQHSDSFASSEETEAQMLRNFPVSQGKAAGAPEASTTQLSPH